MFGIPQKEPTRKWTGVFVSLGLIVLAGAFAFVFARRNAVSALWILVIGAVLLTRLVASLLYVRSERNRERAPKAEKYHLFE